MNILGIMIGTSSTAALMKNGKLVGCASEERFKRKKNIGRYPEDAIEFCLRQGGLEPGDIDSAVFVSHSFDYHHWVVDRDCAFSMQDWLREQHQYWWPKFYENKNVDYFEIFKDKIIPEHYTREIVTEFIRPDRDIRPSLLKNHLGDDVRNIQTVLHYEAHHHYGYYCSPFREERVLSFVLEGWGEGTNATVAMFEKGVYNELYKTPICNIGRLYRYMTLLLGMKPNVHEYKVMGLAAYNSNYQEVMDILSDTLYVDGCEFKYREKPTEHYFWFKERFEGRRFDEIAAGLQHYVEHIISEWVRNWIVKTGVSKIVISGGVAMNIKAMMEVAKMDEVQEMFVPGNGADESNAIGACYLVHAKNCQDSGIAPNSIPLNRDLYLGPSYSRDDVKVAIENHRDKSFKMKEDVLPEEVAKIISGGDPVARFSGKMEFGARALGNRSILADPRNINIVRKINNQIKCRDFWMPFAPVILKERADDYLLNHKNIESPFMTIGFETTPLAQKDLIASLHQGDLTARPQILTEEVNPGYYKLIKEFEVLTGVGGLVNTSFNLHGEPIVNTPEDALHVFFNSGLDYLVLEDVLIYKETESH